MKDAPTAASPLRQFLEALRPQGAEPVLSPMAAEHVEKLRTIRRNAKVAARSGNPAIAGPAQSVLHRVGPAIAEVYRTEAARAGR